MILLAVALLAGCSACESASDSHAEVVEFDFTDCSDGVPRGWSINSYGGRYSKCQDGEGEVGFRTAGGSDDIRLIHTVEVKPETRYVLSGEIRTTNVEDGQGATLSIDNYAIDGCFIYSEALFGTNDWTPVELAFRTAPSQESITLALRLGGYSAESSGRVLFRNIRLEQTDNASVSFQNLTPDESADDADDRTQEDFENVFTVIFWAGAIAAIVLLFGILPRGKQIAPAQDAVAHKYRRFALLVLVGLVVRFVLCAIYKGHATDMLCWKGWGYRVAAQGTHAFYVDNWCDYPPGYMLVCGLLYRIASVFPEGPLNLFVYMLPAFLCDVLSGWLILFTAKRFRLGDRPALLLSGLIVLNPAAVFLSGAWGQIDSILAVMLIGTFLLLNRSAEKPFFRLLAGLLYGAAILMKWQALIFGPVLALMYVMTGIDLWKTKRFWEHVAWSVAAVAGAVCILLLGSALFRGEDMDLFWMVERFRSASSGYDYASIEAYNFHTLFGGNWAKAQNALFGSANVGGMLLRINELFAKAAMLIGFPTLVLRAWNEMRVRRDGEPNHAFYELLSTAIIVVLMLLIRFITTNFSTGSAGSNALFKALADFPLHGLWMLGMFVYLVRRESKGQALTDWIRAGGTTATGALTLFAALCAFVLTFLFGAFAKLIGGTLTWHLYGILGIALAGVLTLALFAVYWEKHRKARFTLYTNRGLIFLLAACFCVWVFTFGHYMHERYIFPALLLLLFAYAFDRDPHKLAAFCMLTVTTFMNEMMAMFVVSDGAKDLIRGGAIHNQLIAVISLLEFCAAMYLTAIAFRKAAAFDPADPTDEGLREKKVQKPSRSQRGGRR